MREESSSSSSSEGVSSPRTVTTIRATHHVCLLCFYTCNFSLFARFTSRLATSLGKVTPYG
jgi:hypothetical protein